jgi:hypothetical protein
LQVEARDARDVAKRVHETTSQIFRFAVARDIASRNPAADFKPRDILAEARTENRARVDARELPELLAKMEDYNGDAITRLAMKLMAYTFVRTSEEIEAPWTAVLTQAGAWRIARNGITIRPLCIAGLRLETRLACRSDSQGRVVSEFLGGFARRLKERTNAKRLRLGLVHQLLFLRKNQDTERSDTVDPWHPDVHQGHIWPVGSERLQGLVAIGCLRRNPHVWLCIDLSRDARHHERVVVDS